MGIKATVKTAVGGLIAPAKYAGRLVGRWGSRVLGHVASSTPQGVAFSVLISVVAATVLFYILNHLTLPLLRGAVEPRIGPNTASDVYPLGDRVVHVIRQSGTQSILADAEWAPRGASAETRPSVAVAAMIMSSDRYIIRKGGRDVALIEVRREQLDAEDRLVADIAYRGSGGVWVRIPWWEENALAASNALARIHGSYVIRTLEFPASTSSVVTWMKERWIEKSKALNGDLYASGDLALTGKQARDQLAPILEQVLASDLGHLQTAGPVTFTRVINGFIQWSTVVAFFAALLTVAARWAVFVRAERDDSQRMMKLAATSSDPHGQWWRTLLDESREPASHHELRWAVPSAVMNTWRGGLNAIERVLEYGSGLQFMESHASLEDANRASRGFFLRFLIGSIPAIGFIGTVVGIGLALMGTGSVLSDQLAKQQSGVSGVALALGLAFDTTLVALILSLFILYLSSTEHAAEETRLHEARRDFQHCLLTYGIPHPAPTAWSGTASTPGTSGPATRPEAGRPAPAEVRERPERGHRDAAPVTEDSWARLVDLPTDYIDRCRKYDRPLLFWLGVLLKSSVLALTLYFVLNAVLTGIVAYVR